ncbi:MAG: hypothetical protein AAF849_02700 [Bacteroidota bacterium]
MRSDTKQQHKFNANNQDIKNKIFKLVDQYDDPFLLNEMFQKLDQIVAQRKGSQMELSPAVARYKKVITNQDREQWALDWLY